MKKVLVIQTASIGDVILATPVLEKLHHFYPEAKIDLLVKKGMESLFIGHPFLNQVITWDKASAKFRDFFRIVKLVSTSRYDAVINLQRFALTGILTSLSGSKVRIGFSKNPFSIFFTQRITHDIKAGVHEIDRNLELIRKITGEGEFRPRLYPSESDQNKTKHLKSSKYITISPASLWFTKQYPESKWLELTDYIPEKTGIFLLGSPADHETCEKLVDGAGRGNIISLAGELTFLESAALMKDAVMNFTNDSAPMHLASAVNAPVCAIYCSTVPDFGFGPLSDDSTIVETSAKLPCRPCGLHGYNSCPEKHFKCATTIEVNKLTFRL